MQYLIKRVINNEETYKFADEQETNEIERGSYARGGQVYIVVRKIAWDQNQRQIELLSRRVNSMRQAVIRWKRKMGLPTQELDPWADHYSESYESRLRHLRTEFIHRHYEDADDGYWVCLRHMIVLNVAQSEELCQQAYEEVQSISSALKRNGIFPTKIYYSKQGWIVILDVTKTEPYM